MHNCKKALILAAGMGMRLRPITDSVPKCMVKVNGISIIEKQLGNLVINDVRDITVVTGYKHNILSDFITSKYPYVNILFNAEYESTNNMYSAYFARSFFDGMEFLMMNADVFYDSSVITALLEDPSPDAIVVEKGRYIDESMKVSFDGNRITGISKQITAENAFGTSIDVYKFSAKGGKVFFDKCADYIENRGERCLWSEVALNDILGSVVFKPCTLNGRWFEIDNHDDLKKAEEIFSVGCE